jgi:hypothetical protein
LNVLAYELKKSKIHTLILKENGNAQYFVNASGNKKKQNISKCNKRRNEISKKALQRQSSKN